MALVLYVALLLRLAPRFLVNKGWVYRSPRIAIFVWLTGLGSVFAAALLSGVLLIAALLPSDISALGMVHACLEIGMRLLPPALTTPVTFLGLALLMLAGLRLVGAHRLVLRRIWAERSRQHLALSLLADLKVGSNVCVLRHGDPIAYCVPGRDPKIVISSAAQESLSPRQLAGVLAHERAHLHGNHHVILTASEAITVAFPRVSAFRTAHSELRTLVEMCADDKALLQCDRSDLGLALLALSRSQAPVDVLAASGHATSERIRRLITPAPRAPCLLAKVGFGGLTLFLASPLLVAVGLTVLPTMFQYCFGSPI